jgi:hypothetical protein
MSDSIANPFTDLASSIMGTFPDPIAVLDFKGTILWCNAATFEPLKSFG